MEFATGDTTWPHPLSLRRVCGDGAREISSAPQGHRKALVTSLPKHKCKLDLQHHTITQLHKSKGVVGKWIGEAAGQGREQKGERDWGRWVRSHSSQAENWAEGKFRWNWTELMTFRKEKEASMIRIAREVTSQLIDFRLRLLKFPNITIFFSMIVLSGGCSALLTGCSCIHTSNTNLSFRPSIHHPSIHSSTS